MSFALAVSIGNTRTQIGRIVDGVVQEFATVPSDSPTKALEQLVAWSKDVEKEELVRILHTIVWKGNANT